MIAAEVIGRIRGELAALERAESVRVLFAVESGSRAWGFASPDSDYDVRLIYVRRSEWYLSIDLEQKRDVIERQLPGTIDLSGWDIRKALRLFAKSNPPLLEWLVSPVVYRDDPALSVPLRALQQDYYCPAACLHHYLRMARGNAEAYLCGSEVRLKKYLYVLRPLLAGLWIAQGRGPVPVPFAELLPAVADRPDLLAAIRDLLARKAASPELGAGPPVPVFHEFAAAELPRLEALAAGMAKAAPDLEPLNGLFRATLR